MYNIHCILEIFLYFIKIYVLLHMYLSTPILTTINFPIQFNQIGRIYSSFPIFQICYFLSVKNLIPIVLSVFSYRMTPPVHNQSLVSASHPSAAGVLPLLGL